MYSRRWKLSDGLYIYAEVQYFRIWEQQWVRSPDLLFALHVCIRLMDAHISMEKILLQKPCPAENQ